MNDAGTGTCPLPLARAAPLTILGSRTTAHRDASECRDKLDRAPSPFQKNSGLYTGVHCIGKWRIPRNASARGGRTMDQILPVTCVAGPAGGPLSLKGQFIVNVASLSLEALYTIDNMFGAIGKSYPPQIFQT